jgi:hypothetical protein
MFTFIYALFGFLLARLIWNAIVHFARKRGELPIVWAAKTAGLVALLVGIVGAFGFAILYVIARHS